MRIQRNTRLPTSFRYEILGEAPNVSLGGGGDLVLGSVNIFSHFSHLSKMFVKV
jgi:hypothetical protein